MIVKEYLQTSEQVEKSISKLLDEKFKIHPFSKGLSLENLETVMGNYLAMSQAFPYLQSGSQKEQIFHCIDTNNDISTQTEITTVVGNFLSWDETGGHYILQTKGIAGLPEILNTGHNFHSNLLKQDMRVIFGKDIKPSYSPVTKEYLYRLYEGISSLDPIVRCASMVAFETHAGQMITALWESFSAFSSIKKDSLCYFKTHVGGDDPAETYHVQMTSVMIEKVVSEDQISDFLKIFEDSYCLNYFWCQSITQMTC
jgi:hypothetical protein